MRGRCGKHRMKNNNHWNRDAVEYTEYLVAIRSAVDSKLVLDYRHIKLIKRLCGLHLRDDRLRDEVTNHIRSDERLWLVDNSNDSGSAAVRHELGSKRRGERGETALCRGVGTQESNRQGHEDNLLVWRGRMGPRTPRRPTVRGFRSGQSPAN